MFQRRLLSAEKPDHPSNVVWENLGISLKSRIFRIVLVYFVSLCILTLTFISILSVTTETKDLYDEFPLVNCQRERDTIRKHYYEDFEWGSIDEQVKTIVLNDWQEYIS